MQIKNIKVFKNSEKFFVFRSKENKRFKVYKIAHKNPKKIKQEVQLLKKLIVKSKILKDKIPKILKHGTIKKGIHSKKGFYILDYIKGFTFTEIVKKNLCTLENFNRINKIIFQIFLKITKEDLETKKVKTKINIKTLILNEFKKIKKRDLMKRFCEQKKIKIDNIEYKNIGSYLSEIFNSYSYKKTYEKKSYMSSLGHWNFHGGNIIFSNVKKNYKNFYLIDPDATWKINDPFFSVARFIYTYIHDTIENKKYHIETKTFKEIGAEKNNFKTKILWSSNIKKKYESNFSEYLSFRNKKNLKFLDKNEQTRLNMCLILCLLRGINSNFEPKIQILDEKGTKFKNNSIYIFFCLLKFFKVLTLNLDINNK